MAAFEVFTEALCARAAPSQETLPKVRYAALSRLGDGVGTDPIAISQKGQNTTLRSGIRVKEAHSQIVEDAVAGGFAAPVQAEEQEKVMAQ